jgi:hypothetical protein
MRGSVVEIKDWLPLAVSLAALVISGVLVMLQRRQSHRLDAIATAFKADVELYKGTREAALASHRNMIERKLASIHSAIVTAQRLKDAIANLLDAAEYPDTFPRAAVVIELESAAEAIEDAHGTLTQWFTLPEMLPLHRCKSGCATLSALVSAQVEGIERITGVPQSLIEQLQSSRELASNAQDQLRGLARSSQFLLQYPGDHAPRLVG